ncbi:MAG TPA: YtxH domain-containing protein [Candidatus Obscuribacterales bacterium]
MSNRFFEGLFVGGLLGFIVGLLYAPKPGAHLRRQLADQSDELYRQASTGISDLKDRTGARLQDIQSRSDHALKQGIAQVQETRDQIASKIQEIGGNSGKQPATHDIE